MCIRDRYGFSESKSEKQHGRLNNDSVIHYGKYNELTEDKIKTLIREYNNHDIPIGLINDWEKFDLENYLDWLFTKWIQSVSPSNDEASNGEERYKDFYNILNKSGFLRYTNFKF